MTGSGGDAADRALDDALALANDRRDDAPDRRRPAANDPLTVALGLGIPPSAATGRPPQPSATRPSRPAAPPRPPRPAPTDPLAVALRHGQEELARASVPPAAAAPAGQGADSDLAADPEPSGRHERGNRPAHGHEHGHERGHHAQDVSWPEARRIARQAARRLPAHVRPLGGEVIGTALVQGLVALTDLPPFDSSAMDGWAVAGTGPWRLKGRQLAGEHEADPLSDGHAAHIATGALLPPGTVAVLRSEHGRTEHRADGEWLRVRERRFAPRPGQEVRRRGQECGIGEELLPAGTVVSPAVLGLAAAAGYDELTVTARPTVELLVLGDELLDRGLPRQGRVRDALGPMLPPWLGALGAEVTSVRRLVDDAGALREAMVGSSADLIITTGGPRAVRSIMCIPYWPRSGRACWWTGWRYVRGTRCWSLSCRPGLVRGGGGRVRRRVGGPALRLRGGRRVRVGALSHRAAR